jgi:hypothetical protein
MTLTRLLAVSTLTRPRSLIVNNPVLAVVTYNTAGAMQIPANGV